MTSIPTFVTSVVHLPLSPLTNSIMNSPLLYFVKWHVNTESRFAPNTVIHVFRTCKEVSKVLKVNIYVANCVIKHSDMVYLVYL